MLRSAHAVLKTHPKLCYNYAIIKFSSCVEPQHSCSKTSLCKCTVAKEVGWEEKALRTTFPHGLLMAAQDQALSTRLIEAGLYHNFKRKLAGKELPEAVDSLISCVPVVVESLQPRC